MCAILSDYPKSIQSLKDLRRGWYGQMNTLGKSFFLKDKKRTNGKREMIKVLLQLFS